MKARLRIASLLPLLLNLNSYAAASYVLESQWPALPDELRLGQPSGVGVDSTGTVFVFHRAGRTWTNPFPETPIDRPAVLALSSSTGALIAQWGAGEFIMPHGLTVDSSDHVWLTDVGRQQVFKYTRDGRRLLTVGERGVAGNDETHFNLPADVAVLPDGSFFVADGYRNTRVVKFSAAGRYEYEWGGKGSAKGQFILPHGLALLGGNRLAVCDRSNARLQIFDLKGTFIAEWKGPDIGRPYGVACDRGGHVFVADGGNVPGISSFSRALELDSDGKLVESVGGNSPAGKAFKLAHDIAVGPQGEVYVADTGSGRVLKYVRR